MATEYKTGDTWPPITGTVKDAAGAAVNISGASSLRFVSVGGSPPKTITSTGAGSSPGQILNVDDGSPANRGKWKYTWAANDLDTEGTFSVEIEITWAAGQIETFPDNKSRNPSFTVTADLD